MSAVEELAGIILSNHGEFCMSMSCDCEAAAKTEAEELAARIRNGE